jgi:hypothetical protein
MTFDDKCTAFQAQADGNVTEIVRDVLSQVAESGGPDIAAFIAKHARLLQHIACASAALAYVAGCEHGAMTAVGGAHAPAGAAH